MLSSFPPVFISGFLLGPSPSLDVFLYFELQPNEPTVDAGIVGAATSANDTVQATKGFLLGPPSSNLMSQQLIQVLWVQKKVQMATSKQPRKVIPKAAQKMMGKVNKDRLGEFLGELQRKESTGDRYVAALRGETLTRNPYVRIQPVPKEKLQSSETKAVPKEKLQSSETKAETESRT